MLSSENLKFKKVKRMQANMFLFYSDVVFFFFFLFLNVFASFTETVQMCGIFYWIYLKPGDSDA